MFFFFKYTATPEIYTYGHTLALHDALPICRTVRRTRAGLVQGERAALGVAGQLGAARNRPNDIAGYAQRRRWPVIAIAGAGALGTSTVQHWQGNGRTGAVLAVVEVGGVVALHVIGIFRQTAGSRRAPGFGDVVVVRGQGDRGQDRDDRHHDHQLDQGEEIGRAHV